MNKEKEIAKVKNPQEFLNKISHHTVKIGDEVVELFKLGNFDNQSTWELVGLAPGEYKQHIHDKTQSILRIVYGLGTILLGNKKSPYQTNDTFTIGKGEKDGFSVKESTLLLSIQDKAIYNAETGEIDFRYVDNSTHTPSV